MAGAPTAPAQDLRYRLYTKWDCPACRGAKLLLTHFHLPYEEVDLSDDAARSAFYAARGFAPGTVPKIYLLRDGEEAELVGGFDELPFHIGANIGP